MEKEKLDKLITKAIAALKKGEPLDLKKEELYALQNIKVKKCVKK